MAFVNDMAARAPATQRFLLILMLSGAAGGAGAAGHVGTATFYLAIGGEVLLAEQAITQMGEAEREQAQMMMANTRLQASGTIDPSQVHFSQDDISPVFKDKTRPPVDDLARGLKDGTIKADDIPPIKVTEIDGKIYTLDNRRLHAFQQAGVPIRYELATPKEVAEAIRKGKFSTRNGGRSIRVRGR